MTDTFPPQRIIVPTVPPLDERMTPAAAAEHLGVSEATLRNWRSQRKGPPYYRVGRVFYWIRDLDYFVARSRVDQRRASRDVTRC